MAENIKTRTKEFKREVERLKLELSQYKALTISSGLRVKELKKEVEKLKSELSQSAIQRRQSKRIMVSLIAEIILDGASYVGFIENISERGLHMRIGPMNKPLDFTPGQTLKLKLRLPTQEILNPDCNIKWFYKTPPHGLIDSLGIEILNPHPKYKAFLQTLR